MLVDSVKSHKISPFCGQDTSEFFKEATEYVLPKKSEFYTQTHYFDGDTWVVLERPLHLKKTAFADDRLFALNAVESTMMPVDLEPSLSGIYNTKLYTKRGVFLCFEGDHKVLMKLPFTKTIISWNSEDRFPVFTKDWRPTYYMLNDMNIFIRITPDKCLVICKLKNEESYQVKCIDFTDGFVCCHPITNLAILNGSYNQNQEGNVMKLPPLPPSNGKYNYFIMFFDFGTFIIPKSLTVDKGPLCNARSTTVALLVIPPRLQFIIELKSNGSFHANLDYGTDFLITVKKSSLTEFEVYLFMHKQIVRVEHSFDIRLNKESAPVSTIRVPFSFKILKEEKEKKKKDPSYECKWTFDNTKDQKVLLKDSNIIGEHEHLMTTNFACLFDAEEGTYYSNEHAIKHCKIINLRINDRMNKKE